MSDRNSSRVGLLVAEAAEHRGGHGGRVLLLDAAHHHAQVPCLDHHAHALRLDDLLDGFGDLRGQPLLHLQAAREDLDQARQLAQPDHFALRNVGDVHLAEEGQQVMFAEAEHLDVLHDHHLVVVDVEQRAFQQLFRIFAIALGQILQGLGIALGRVQQSSRAGSSPRRTIISRTRSAIAGARSSRCFDQFFHSHRLLFASFLILAGVAACVSRN